MGERERERRSKIKRALNTLTLLITYQNTLKILISMHYLGFNIEAVNCLLCCENCEKIRCAYKSFKTNRDLQVDS